MPDTPEGSNAANEGDAALAVSLGRIIRHFDEVKDAYSAGRALALGLQAWLETEKILISDERCGAVLAAIARARSAVADTVPRASLARITDGLDALAESVAGACGASPLAFEEADDHRAIRIALAQAEAATAAMLVSALFDELDDRPRALVAAAEWNARAMRLGAEIAARGRRRLAA